MTTNRSQKNLDQGFETPRRNIVAGMRNADVIAEDGWIFVERPGERVKCVRRYVPQEDGEMAQPNLARHHYPSN